MSKQKSGYKLLKCEVLSVSDGLYEANYMWWKDVIVTADGKELATSVGFTDRSQTEAIEVGSIVDLWVYVEES